MKVRAVTYFISASSFDELCHAIAQSVSFFRVAIAELKARGVSLQMARIATNSLEQWSARLPYRAIEQLHELDALLGFVEQQLGGQFSVICSIGQLEERLDDGVLVTGLTTSLRIFACVAMRVSADGLPDVAHAHRCAALVLAINEATRSTRGEIVDGPLAGAPFAFKLAVTCGLGPGTPFFPGASAPRVGESCERLSPSGTRWQAPAFAFACENSDLLVRAFARARARVDPGAAPGALLSSPELGSELLRQARAELEREFTAAVGQLEELGLLLEGRCAGVAFAGTDSSVASAASPSESLVVAFESLGLGPFGGAGTLTLSALVTRVLKALPFRLVGYCGLMLPQTEDAGLGALAARGGLSISTLLLNSAVCGTGIDTVVVPSDASASQIAGLYCDVASMSARLAKPLSVRVWPAPGARAGDAVSFSCPFFVDSAALALDPEPAQAAAVQGAANCSDGALRPSPSDQADAEPGGTLRRALALRMAGVCALAVLILSIRRSRR